MLKDDYILRLIEQFIQTLHKVLGLLKDQEFEAALTLIDQALERAVGLGLDTFTTLSRKDLLAILEHGGPNSTNKAKYSGIAALLNYAGTINTHLQEPDKSYLCYLRALELLLDSLLEDTDESLPSYAPTLTELLTVLAPYTLPTETSLLLLRYYERIGLYAKAEDTLFEMLDNEPNNLDLIESGVAFYHRLQQEEDGKLIAGNLPRAEVEMGLAEVKNRR